MPATDAIASLNRRRGIVMPKIFKRALIDFSPECESNDHSFSDFNRTVTIIPEETFATSDSLLLSLLAHYSTSKSANLRKKLQKHLFHHFVVTRVKHSSVSPPRGEKELN